MQTTEILEIVALIIALAVAIIGHEIMHGYVAYLNGDDTAKIANRLSINPIVHIDPIGTILVPAMLHFSGAGFLFGWAKPVPINIRTVMKNGGYNGAIAVSLAGIAYNFTVAIIATVVLKLLSPPVDFITYFIDALLTYTVIYNVVLGIFNLFPIPPLDGSHALSYLFRKANIHKPADFLDSIGQYGMFILMAIIAIPGLSRVIFSPIQDVIKMLLG
jgi:Zn-dependent protease